MFKEEQSIDESYFERLAQTSQVERTSIQMTRDDILKALEHDGRFFIHFFLGDEIEYDIPPFHLDTWELMTNPRVEKSAHALPRGHAKTTLAKLAAVHQYLFTDMRYGIYLSNTHGVAAEACEDIISYMTCPNFIAVFGAPEFEVEQHGKGFYKFWITLPHKLDQYGNAVRKFCILRAFGAGQQIRGTNIDNERPEFAVCDDIEDDDNTATKALIEKLRIWFYGAFIKAMSQKRQKIIFLGNMLSAQSLLYHFTTKSNMWYSQRFGCLLSDGEPLWPDIWPIEKIKEDFLEYQQQGLVGRWFAEMMNIAMPDSSPLIKSDEIPYAAPISPDDVEYAFITIDPAISQKNWADNSAIVVHAYAKGKWHVPEYALGRFTPNEIFFTVKELCERWRTRVVGTEAAGYQQALRFIFEILMHMHQFSFTVLEVPHGNTRKTDRLAVWASYLRKDIYVLDEGDFGVTEQLLRYDPSKKENDDDLIDACAQGPIMIENYLAEIISDYAVDDVMYEVVTTTEVMGV